MGALGHLFGPNAERGVFRSKDGGASWEKVLYLDDRHGVADMDMSPTQPQHPVRGALALRPQALDLHERQTSRAASGAASTAARTWKRLTKGLPKLMGRIGVKVAPSDPRVVYVIAESDEGTLFRSDDGGDSFKKVSDKAEIVSRGLYYTDMRVHPTNPDVVFAVASLLQKSIDGGKTWERISRNTHIDFHALWIDPIDPDRMWQGQDGGVAVSYDGGKAWEPVRNLPIAQFYQVQADNREPFYYLGGGLQDNGTWWGPSRTREPAGILEDDWRMPSFGDAYYVVIHPDDPDVMISESQGGDIMRTDLRTREQQVDISPQPKRNDGGPAGDLQYRFNWNTPIVASPHDGKTVYFTGNVVFRTRDFGDTWQAISPDLTTNDKREAEGRRRPGLEGEHHRRVPLHDHQLRGVGRAEGRAVGRHRRRQPAGLARRRSQTGRTSSRTSRAFRRSRPSRTSSPRARIRAPPGWPSTATCSTTPRPYVFKTTDFGKTWTRLTAGLPPQGFVWVVRQDPKNPRLLCAGTELGLYASHDEGKSWRRLQLKNLPTVAVHDILVHPRENDLILGTHGRALFVFDDATPLQQLRSRRAAPGAALRRAARAALPVALHALRPRRQGVQRTQPAGGRPHQLRAAREDGLGRAEGARAEGARRPAKPARRSPSASSSRSWTATGKVIRTLKKLGLEKGLNRVAWDLRYDAPFPRKEGEEGPSEFGPPPGGQYALPGTYTARLTVDGKAYEKPVVVRVDPTVKTSPAALQAQFEMAGALLAHALRAQPHAARPRRDEGAARRAPPAREAARARPGRRARGAAREGRRPAEGDHRGARAPGGHPSLRHGVAALGAAPGASRATWTPPSPRPRRRSRRTSRSC